MNYRWPGNIRELEHVIERAIVISEGPILQIPPLSRISHEPASSETPCSTLKLEDCARWQRPKRAHFND